MTSAASTTLEAVRSRLERVSGPDRAGWYTARCPFHDDHDPSLRFTDVGFKCMACDEHGSLSDLMTRLAGASPGPATATPQGIATTYDYVDERGSLLFQAVRKRPKGFFQRRPDGRGGWINDLKGVRLVLYRLPDVLCADPGAAPFVVEGEKDADRLWTEGVPATANPMGAGKWRDEYSEHLRNRHIVILPDNDEAGRKHATAVARSLHGVAAEVRILELPGLPEKGDISDWLNAGGTAEGLLTLAADCATWAPGTTASAEEPKGECARSDAGNGELFAQLYGDRVRYDHRRSRWLVWSGHHWTDDADGEVRRLAKLAVRHRQLKTYSIDDLTQRASAARFAIQSESRQRLEALLSQAQSEPPISDAGTQWDHDAWSLGVANGVVDLRSGQIRQGQPNDRITMHVPVTYDPNATCPRWLQFLDEVFSGNAELIDFIQRAAGYSLTAMTTEQCLFLCYGTGSNGKSVFLNVLREAAGQYGHNASFSLFELRSRSAIPNDVAALYNRRLVTSSETNEGTRLNEARVKALTGGDRLSARFLHAEFFEFDPTGKYWLAVNHKPNVQDDSHGFWRRVRLIPFTRQFSGAGADSQLLLSLRGELAGILAWAVRGAHEWHQRGLAAPDAVRAATETYRIESDPLARFIDERCVINEDASALASRAYKAYRLWGLDEGMNDKELLSSTMFGTKMTARFEKKKRNDGWHYIGVGLRSERPDPEPDQATTEDADAPGGEEVTGCESEYPSLSGSSLVTSSTRENIDQPVTPVTPVTIDPASRCKRCGLSLSVVAVGELCGRCVRLT